MDKIWEDRQEQKYQELLDQANESGRPDPEEVADDMFKDWLDAMQDWRAEETDNG